MPVTYKAKAQLLKAGADKAEDVEVEIANWNEPYRLLGTEVIQLVYLPNRTVLMIDENAKIRRPRKERNDLATAKAGRSLSFGDYIAGDALLLSVDDMDKCEQLLQADEEGAS